jgi:cyclohexadienyl dehydratase
LLKTPRRRIAPPIGARKSSIRRPRVKPHPRGRALIRVLVVLLLGAVPAGAEVLRVGTSGDYAPFSLADSPTAPFTAEHLRGLDVELIQTFAKEQGRAVEFVRFRWPELREGMRDGRFDVAVGGITIRAERSVRGIFTRPVVETGSFALVRDAARFPDAARLADARIAVNAGGHLERVARSMFPRARIVAVPDNAEPPRLLAAGEADAALTDSFEAPLWQRQVPKSLTIGPLTRDAKAFWVRPDRPELAGALDRWLALREEDGTLAARRAEWLGTDTSRAVAAPLPALLGAIRERLALAPLVAEAKRAKGLPIEAPEQEARVLDAAVRTAREAAARRGRPAIADARVRALFEAQIAAGKAIQQQALAGPPPSEPPFDLDTELRPALARISERLLDRWLELPSHLAPDAIRRETAETLFGMDLAPAEIDAIAAAISGGS